MHSLIGTHAHRADARTLTACVHCNHTNELELRASGVGRAREMVRLSAEHLRQYETDGYLVIENCASLRFDLRLSRATSVPPSLADARATWADASTS